MSRNENNKNLDFLAFEDANGYRVDVFNPTLAAQHIEFQAIAECAKLVDAP